MNKAARMTMSTIKRVGHPRTESSERKQLKALVRQLAGLAGVQWQVRAPRALEVAQNFDVLALVVMLMMVV